MKSFYSTTENVCGPNEEFSNCGSVCTETCDYKPQICVMMCKSGCFCQEGYVRESNLTGSPCIKREKCSLIETPTCSENEVFLTCGTMCPTTCDDFSYPLPKPIKICPKMCVQGCFCKEGLYRAKDGRCVKQQQCCGENEVFTDCGTACPETCGSNPLFCTEQCVAGCFCRDSDYVRMKNSTGSSCIHRSRC